MQRQQLGMFKTEQTDQGEQAVIPGTEKISDREMAERRMKAPLRARAKQRPMDKGLFDEGAGRQIDLEEAIEAKGSACSSARGAPRRRRRCSTDTIGVADKAPYKRFREWLKNATDRRGLYWRQGFIDSFSSFDALERRQNKGVLADADVSATKAAHMTKNLQSVMAVLLRHGMIDLQTDAARGTRRGLMLRQDLGRRKLREYFQRHRR